MTPASPAMNSVEAGIPHYRVNGHRPRKIRSTPDRDDLRAAGTFTCPDEPSSASARPAMVSWTRERGAYWISGIPSFQAADRLAEERIRKARPSGLR